MNSRTRPARRQVGRTSHAGRMRNVLVPACAVALGIAVLAADAYFCRQSERDKYALPEDRSPTSLLAFMREMDGSAAARTGFLSSSNTDQIAHAVVRAHAALAGDLESLPVRDRREAEYMYLVYAGYLRSMSEGEPNDLAELQRSALQFLRSAKEFTKQEGDVVLGTTLLLDRRRRFDDELQFALTSLEELQRFEDSLEAQELVSELTGVRHRLELRTHELELESTTLEGRQFRLRDHRGKVVMIEFYGTHCVPCIRDFPALRQIYARYKPDGFEIVGICLHAQPARIKNFSEEHQLPWIQLSHEVSAGRRCNESLSDRFGIHAVPSTILVDRSGKVSHLGVRPHSPDPQSDLESVLVRLLAEKPPK